MLELPVINSDSHSLPAACHECSCKGKGTTWNIPARRDDREETKNQESLGVLVVVGVPGKAEDRQSSPITGREWQFLSDYLEELETRWMVVNSITCYPGYDGNKRKDIAPREKDKRGCAESFLLPLIEKEKPKVIVCLGLEAMKAVLGKNAPGGLTKAIGYPIKPLSADYHIVCANAPGPHVNGKKNLEEEYFKAFMLADSIALGEYGQEVVDLEIVSTAERAMQVGTLLQEVISYDVETTNNKKNPNRPTPWHTQGKEGAKLPTASFTDKLPSGNYRTFVFDGPAITPETLTHALKGRVVIGHNIKSDINSTCAITGVDIFKICKDYICTFLLFVCRDNGRIGNSLKALARLWLNAPVWENEMKYQMDQFNIAIAQAHKQVKTLLKETEKELKKNPEDSEISDRVTYLKDKIKNLRPLGASDYGDPDPKVRAVYCGHDTHYTHRLYHEVVLGEKAEPYSTSAYDLCKKNIYTFSQVERNGLPLLPHRIEIFENLIQDKIREFKICLLRSPYVQRTLASNKRFQNLYFFPRGAIRPTQPDQEEILKFLSPKATKFLVRLAEETGVTDMLPRTAPTPTAPQGNYIFDEDILELLSGGDDDTPEQLRLSTWTPSLFKTEIQKVWWSIWKCRKYYDMIAKFLKNVKLFRVGNKVHSDFVLARVDMGSANQGAEKSGGTTTGRLSSRDMNIHNLPKNILRWIFGLPKEEEHLQEILVENDFSSVEPVVLSVVANCPSWQDIFVRGLDFYMCIANIIYGFGIDITQEASKVTAEFNEKISTELRNFTKVSCLAIIYEQSPGAFAKRTGLPLDKVMEFYAKFNERFPEVVEYKKKMTNILNKQEFAKTLFDRWRKFPLPRTGNREEDRKIYASERRKIINYCIQSAASDITCWKAYEVQKWIEKHNLGKYIRIVNVVHDSLWLVIRKIHYKILNSCVKTIMQDMSTLPFDFPVPLRVADKVGEDLFSMVKPEKYFGESN